MIVALNDVPVGYELPALTKLITLERSQAYRGWPLAKNLHTDERIARKLGFPGVIMAGMQGGAVVSQLCTGFFGDAWLHRGKLSLNFIKTVVLPMSLTARGVVSERLVKGGNLTLVLDVWVEDESGEKVQVGTARATVENGQ